MWCVAVCCGVLRCVAMCCDELQWVDQGESNDDASIGSEQEDLCLALNNVCRSVLQRVAACCSENDALRVPWDGVCCRALQCVVLCCSVLQQS